MEGIQVASSADVDKAVAAARTAFNGEWSTWTAQQRSNVMIKFADLFDKHAEEIGSWETKSMGQPVSILKWLSVMVGNTFRYYSGWTNKQPGEQWPEEDGIYRVRQAR